MRININSQQKKLIASIAVSNTTYHFDKLFDYEVPNHLQVQAVAGCRVMVPFGGANKKQQGIIVNTIMSFADCKLKPIESVLDSLPILNEELLLLGQFIAQRYFCTLFTAYKSLFPTGLGLKINELFTVFNGFDNLIFANNSNEKAIYDFLVSKGSLQSAEQIATALNIEDINKYLKSMVLSGALLKDESISQNTGISIAKMAQINLAFNFDEVKLTPKQKLIYNFLIDNTTSSFKEIIYYTGVTQSVISNMVIKDYLITYNTQIYRDAFKHIDKTEKNENIVLSKQQTEGYNTLLAEYKSNKASVNLLYGVTGSGKTAVYISLIKEIINDKKTALVLIPEIALTNQSLMLFYENFGERVAVLHSGLSIGQRMDEWHRINNDEVDVVVGTRSAIFAPLKNIGVIVIDEEHDSSYKSDHTPKFHARTLAQYRSAYHKCPLILASATPSIDSYSRAIAGSYNLIKLPMRFNQGDLPDVTLVDMRMQRSGGNNDIFSDQLSEAIADNLQKQHQTILLLNRRGYNTVVTCCGCHQTVMCEQCDIAMTYHSVNNKLMCHYCGATKIAEPTCSNCGGNTMRMRGSGTQKIEEHLTEVFPAARVLRIDTDIVNNKLILEQKIDDFLQNKYDIIIGTQMIAKGFNFPNVTLVGVINADTGLYSNDFRSFERTFALLTQVVGRAGRHKLAGRAIIQTYSPEVEIFNEIKTQDYEKFYEGEIRTRRLMTYPPYCDMCQIIFSGTIERRVADTAKNFYTLLKEIHVSDFCDVKLLLYNYTPAEVTKVENKFRYKILIKCKNNARFRELIMKTYKAMKVIDLKHTQISIDINPENII